MEDPKLTIKYQVVAYDEGGYGDNRSKDFPGDQEVEAVAYARSLPKLFGASVTKIITMQPIYKQIYSYIDPD